MFLLGVRNAPRYIRESGLYRGTTVAPLIQYWDVDSIPLIVFTGLNLPRVGSTPALNPAFRVKTALVEEALCAGRGKIRTSRTFRNLKSAFNRVETLPV